MDRLRNAEILVNKCGISFEEAQEVLDAAGDDLLEAMIILEKRGRIPHGGMTTSNEIIPAGKRASDADSFREFMGMIWKGFISAVSVIIHSQVNVSYDGGSFDIPFILALLLLVFTRFIASVILVVTVLAGVRYSIKVRE
ncbi:MAG: hypothetical protein IJ080_00085 [Oscillospiraceae bacterium]|nr:hypothetical protein [Oscillospiraceae bacterium]MBQ8978146.1 hypothetical protein [Oscillospiraceae bacterium]